MKLKDKYIYPSIIAFSITFSIFSFLIISMEHHNGIGGLWLRANNAAEVLAGVNKENIWNIDDTNIQISCKAFFKDPAVIGITIIGSRNEAIIDMKRPNPGGSIIEAKQEVIRNNEKIGQVSIRYTTYYALHILYQIGFIVLCTALFIIAILTFIFVKISNKVTKPFESIIDTLKIASDGDLTHELAITTKDEISSISLFFNTMIRQQRTMIGNIIQSTNNTARIAEELSAFTEEVSQTTTDINRSINAVLTDGHTLKQTSINTEKKMKELQEQISLVVEANSQTIQEAKNVNDTAKQAILASYIAQDKINALYTSSIHSRESVAQLKNKSEQIHHVIEVINSISEQTNLLSLNAAIEAARAGAHGKGFAVVADEVRKLAERTNESTEKIQEIINEIMDSTDDVVLRMQNDAQKVEEGSNTVNRALKQLEQIGDQVNNLTNKFESIESVAQMQQDIANTVDGSIKEVRTIAENSVQLIYQASQNFDEVNVATAKTATIACSLAADTTELMDLVNKFKVKG